jgi:hypothetical protein
MTIPPTGSSQTLATPRSTRSTGWQVTLRSLILMMAVIAVWMAVYINKNEIQRLENRNQPLVHELEIVDANKFAVVKLDSLWMNDHRWDVYLPPGEYRVCMASREVGYPGLCAPRKTATIQAGRHRLALDFQRERDRWPIRLTSDGSELIAFDEVKEWGASGSSADHQYGQRSKQEPLDQPLVLYRRQYLDQNNQGGPPETWKSGEGLLLWIERVGPSNPKP